MHARTHAHTLRVEKVRATTCTERRTPRYGLLHVLKGALHVNLLAVSTEKLTLLLIGTRVVIATTLAADKRKLLLPLSNLNLNPDWQEVPKSSPFGDKVVKASTPAAADKPKPEKMASGGKGVSCVHMLGFRVNGLGF